MSNVIGVIQARMGSSRVPGKAMLDLAGRPLLWHILDRMRRVRGVNQIILATTKDPANEILRQFANEEGIGFFAHPDENDLVGRIAGAIKDEPGTFVLKTGGDCPLVDPDVLQIMVNTALRENEADFVSNRVKWSYPLGLSADVLSRSAIEWAKNNLKKAEDKELFALYIRDHPEKFNVVPVVSPVNLSHHRWTVDEPEDVEFIKRIFSALYRDGQVFGMSDVLDYLENIP